MQMFVQGSDKLANSMHLLYQSGITTQGNVTEESLYKIIHLKILLI